MAGIGIGISPLVYNGQLQKTMRAWRNYSDTTLAVTPLSSTSMGLAWTNPVIQGATLEGVLVYRGTDGVNFTLTETLGVVTSWTDTTCSNGTLYYYYLVFVTSRSVRTAIGTAVSARTIEYVDYLQSTGTQYINTNIIVPVSDVHVKAKIKDTGQTIFGTFVSNDLRYYLYVQSNILYLRSKTVYQVNYTYNNEIKVDVISDTEFYFNDVRVSGTLTGYNSGVAEYVFALAAAGSYKLIGRLYYIQRGSYYNYKPSINALGQFCMFDEVSKTYKLNAGTGVFLGGGVTTAKIDELLIRYAAEGVTGVVLNFTGDDNGTRTSASDAAVATLTAAGCTILVNP